MSNRNLSTDNAKTSGQAEPKLANYTLELELSTGTDVFKKLANVHAHQLQSGFMVVKYAGGEMWFRASDIIRLTKSYM